jgi:CubicO group peptidase (beta-lactamase class C family)
VTPDDVSDHKNAEVGALSGIAAWPGGRRSAGWRARDGRTDQAGDLDGPYKLASVTKLLTAMAVLVAVEEGTISLDEPAGPPGSTVRLLLCHASGLPFQGTTPIARPGQRRIYGNPAFEALGALVEDRAAMPFGDYVAEAVTQPLGMAETTWGRSPAYGARSTVPDLLRLAGELLAPGAVLAPETLAEATTAQRPELRGMVPGVGRFDPNPWGLGFELHGAKAPHWMPPSSSPRTFGHFGQTGSFLWVDPDAGVAGCGLAEKSFGDWAMDAWPTLGDAILAAAASP